MPGEETSTVVGAGFSAADAVAAMLEQRQAGRTEEWLQRDERSVVRTWVVDLASGRIVRGQPTDQDAADDQDTEER
jgi:hypothetical protein